jgi:hypothetical protein
MTGGGKTTTLSPEEEAEREDEQKLAENGNKIEEIIQLLHEKEDRDTAQSKVAERYGLVGRKEPGRRFHDHKGKKIPMSAHTSNLMGLTEALELQIKTGKHGRDLHRALQGLTVRRVAILERMLRRVSGE